MPAAAGVLRGVLRPGRRGGDVDDGANPRRRQRLRQLRPPPAARDAAGNEQVAARRRQGKEVAGRTSPVAHGRTQFHRRLASNDAAAAAAAPAAGGGSGTVTAEGLVGPGLGGAAIAAADRRIAAAVAAEALHQGRGRPQTRLPRVHPRRPAAASDA